MKDSLLDTNVPSELTNVRPDARVRAWIESQPDDSMYLSVITLGEMRKGLSLLDPGSKRVRLTTTYEQKLLPQFHGRILLVTQAVAELWGEFSAQSKLVGRKLADSDGLIAATAVHHNLTLVTRNTRDFVHLGIDLLNPWEL